MAAADPPASPPTPSIPLRLAGFLNGSTVSVEGDAGHFRFSGHFDIHHQPNARDLIFSASPQNPLVQLQNQEEEKEEEFNSIEPLDLCHTPEDHRIISVTEKCVTTRLRSGAISPVSYFQHRRRRSREAKDVLKRLLRRRSLPVKPCNSYNLFVMANWGAARCSTFEETNKRLCEMWHGLHESDKQEYVAMALKDRARYKKQCAVLLGGKSKAI